MFDSFLVWHLLILPLRIVAWTVLFCLLLLVLAGQAVLSLIQRRNRLGADPVPLLWTAFNGGTVGTRFDKRFVLTHPAMTLRKFARIYFQGAHFETSFDELFVCNADQAAIAYLGHVQEGDRIERDRLAPPFENFVVVAKSVASDPEMYFSVLITNQSGFGFGIANGEKLVFERLGTESPSSSSEGSASGSGSGTGADAEPEIGAEEAFLFADATVRPYVANSVESVGSLEPTVSPGPLKDDCLGRLVGAVKLDGSSVVLPSAEGPSAWN